MDAGNYKNGSTESTVQAYRADGRTHVGLYECPAVKGEGGGRGVFPPKTSTRYTRGPKMHKPGLIPLAD
jgi:hypothetical protein